MGRPRCPTGRRPEPRLREPEFGVVVRSRGGQLPWDFPVGGTRREPDGDELQIWHCRAPVTEYALKLRPVRCPRFKPAARAASGRCRLPLWRSATRRAGALRQIYRLAVVLVTTVLLVAGGIRPAASEGETRVFEGAWFQVAYPADFVAVPSLPSATAEGYDSAFFRSPDGAVEFYVFAPQWGGQPEDIALDPGREELVLTSINQRAMLDRWHGDWRGDADRADGG
jgi:hypothetical protein